jgi:hypothetical protein
MATEVAITALKFGVPEGDNVAVRIIPANAEVKKSDFPEGVYDEFKENGAIGTPSQPTVAMEDENAKLRAQVDALKAQLAANKVSEKPPAK